MSLRRIATALMGTLLLSWNAIGEVPIYTPTAITEEMLFADDPQSWATPKMIVQPDFPAEQLAANASGYVDIDVTIDLQGDVTSASVVKSMPPNPAFEKAVLDVVKLWLFSVKLSDNYVPIVATANVRTWFEIRDGKGVVSVSGQASSASATPQRLPRKSKWRNPGKVFASLRYPFVARQEGVQADVYATARIEPSTGDVADSEVTWIRTLPQGTVPVVDAFKAAVTNALNRAKFEPGEGKPYKVCAPFTFRLTN